MEILDFLKEWWELIALFISLGGWTACQTTIILWKKVFKVVNKAVEDDNINEKEEAEIVKVVVPAVKESINMFNIIFKVFGNKINKAKKEANKKLNEIKQKK